MLALVDGDIVAYRCAASAENEPLDVALLRTDKLMRDILEESHSDTSMTFLSDKKNFRHSLYPFYKANRAHLSPRHLNSCKQYLIEEWKATSKPNLEADDLLGIHQSNETIICTIDKDLLQVPGEHYNFVTKEFQLVTEFKGLYNFYTQLLVGDRADNIPGVSQIGKTKAFRILEGCQTEDDLFDAVRSCYNNDDLMYLYGRLLWILRKEGDIWNPIQIGKLSLGEIQLEHEQEVESVYTQMQTTE